MSDMRITLLGTSAAVPTTKRNVSATALQREGDLLLFDCGEGTQRQMQRFTGLKAPTAIFLTHYHPDHWLGLPGLLATLDMQENEKPVRIFGPSDGLGNIKSICQRSGGCPEFAHFYNLEAGEVTKFDTGFSITTFKTDHTKHSLGYVLEEPTRPGRFDPHLAVLSGIEPGPDFKRLQNGEEVKGLRPQDVTGPPRKGRKVAITGDTAPTQQTSDYARNADVLIHEATFEAEQQARAKATRHSTGSMAGRIAAEARVDRLILTHFSPRSDTSLVARQASEHHSPTLAGHDGMQIVVDLEP